MLKKIIEKLEKKLDNDVDADVTQLERNNNKCYASAYIYIECNLCNPIMSSCNS